MLIGILSLISVIIGVAVCLLSGSFAGYGWLWMLPVVTIGSFLVQAGGVFGCLMYLCKKVDLDVPQEQDDSHYRKVTNLLLKSVLPILQIRVKKNGLEKVPTDRRFMLVCNHVSLSDPILIMYALPKSQLAFISKRENRDMFVIGPMMHKLQCQLINRENDREALKTILTCINILKEDKASVAVFPEGGIHNDLKFHQFRPGVFKIAHKANVPIVVCTLKGSKNVIHNLTHLKRSDAVFSVLTVMEPEEFKGITTIDLAQRIHKIMADDLGPEEVAED